MEECEFGIEDCDAHWLDPETTKERGIHVPRHEEKTYVARFNKSDSPQTREIWQL